MKIHNCIQNGLKINKTKPQIAIFHKGRFKNDVNFLYGGEKIEIVSEFSCLGILFSISSLFAKNKYKIISLTQAAVGRINSKYCQ